MSTFNWHKHPNSLIHPSGGDVHEGLNDMNETYPDACVYFYTIVVAVNESEARAKQNDPTCLVLPRDTYGGTRSYIARSYKMFR